MSKDESIPQDFLENILLNLKREGLVESKKGKGGGYALAIAPEELTMGTIIRMARRAARALAVRQRNSLP